MSTFRSEIMSKCQLFLPKETAYSCMAELGEIGLVQLIDVNPELNSFQRKFVKEVKRCDQMERKVRFLRDQMNDNGISIRDHKPIPESPSTREMIDLDVTLDKLENELNEINENTSALKGSFIELMELDQVLKKAQNFFDQSVVSGATRRLTYDFHEEDNASLLSPESGMTSSKLSFIAGVILQRKVPSFERILWRVCHNNILVSLAEIKIPLEDVTTDTRVRKSVFIIFFRGNKLKTRVKQICDGFGATIYTCPNTPEERRAISVGVRSRLDDLSTILEQSMRHRRRVLIAASKSIDQWRMKISKMKAVYHHLNLLNLDVTRECLIGECWLPTENASLVRAALLRVTGNDDVAIPAILNRIETTEEPPTYNKTNKFTSVFQSVVDAYGVASYRELNPAIYTVITFPFLFALMFGDVGHGMIVFAYALWMIRNEEKFLAKKITSAIWEMFFAGRYIILLLGIFSIYVGLLYNDAFGCSFNVFPSVWRRVFSYSEVVSNKVVGYDPVTDYANEPYPFGLDPVWMISTNQINVFNSIKMKSAIVIGVTHMMFGISLNLFNYLHFRKIHLIFCQLLPQVVFMSALFVYLVILIFFKWITFGPQHDEKHGSSCAPSILITFINMMLLKEPRTPVHCDKWMYDGQKIVQQVLLLISLLCVPWMLFSLPAYRMWRQRSTKRKDGYMLIPLQSSRKKADNVEHSGGDSVDEPNETQSATTEISTNVVVDNVSDMLIGQAIHTIEFVLGSVSHTASYLRLWALSLAHSQLSHVLWEFVLAKNIFMFDNPWLSSVSLFFGFALFACLTIAILVLMEGLSAFLHTLRLHWVEFQSKFYDGQGYPFAPFSFKTVLRHAEENSDE